jgi:uncharacterized membrane protein
MTPSQRTTLAALAAGAVGFVVLFALGVNWPIAVILGIVLAVSVGFTLNYLAPSDKQSELDDNFVQIDKAAATIRALSGRVSDRKTAAALRAGCDGVPRMIALIRDRDIRVGLPLSQRSLSYLAGVQSTLEAYTQVQHGGDPEYIRLGQQELRRFAKFTAQPDKELSARQMDEYINSLTALNMNPPPELS